jgi:hypothetical protein
VCSAQLQRGAAFDETQPPSEKNMDYKKLQEDLTILQVLVCVRESSSTLSYWLETWVPRADKSLHMWVLRCVRS